MEPTILFLLLGIVTAVWVVMAVIRDRAAAHGAYAREAMQVYMHERNLRDSYRRYQTSIKEAPDFKGMSEAEGSEPKMPDWIHEYVEVIQDENGWGGYRMKASFGGYLAEVPALWFHCTFAALILVLLGLSSVSI